LDKIAKDKLLRGNNISNKALSIASNYLLLFAINYGMGKLISAISNWYHNKSNGTGDVLSPSIDSPVLIPTDNVNSSVQEVLIKERVTSSLLPAQSSVSGSIELNNETEVSSNNSIYNWSLTDSVLNTI
jgi:hypothetical protein